MVSCALVSGFVFNDAVGRRGEKNGQQNSVATYVAPEEGGNERIPFNFHGAGFGEHAEILWIHQNVVSEVP